MALTGIPSRISFPLIHLIESFLDLTELYSIERAASARKKRARRRVRPFITLSAFSRDRVQPLFYVYKTLDFLDRSIENNPIL